jgi:hypothetical protein
MNKGRGSSVIGPTISAFALVSIVHGAADLMLGLITPAASKSFMTKATTRSSASAVTSAATSVA